MFSSVNRGGGVVDRGNVCSVVGNRYCGEVVVKGENLEPYASGDRLVRLRWQK